MTDADVEEEYDGPARLTVDGSHVDVHVRLSGHFEPISGCYRWTGRLYPDPGLAAAVRPSVNVVLRTADGHQAEGLVREEDPWGGFRVTGTGRPPFAVPREAP